MKFHHSVYFLPLISKQQADPRHKLITLYSICAVTIKSTVHVSHYNEIRLTRYDTISCIRDLDKQLFNITRYMHVHQVPHTEHMESSKSSASEVNHSCGDTQVVSCHRYLVVFHPFVEQLTVFHISGLVLASSSIFWVLDLDLHAIVQWHPERHVPKGM